MQYIPSCENRVQTVSGLSTPVAAQFILRNECINVLCLLTRVEDLGLNSPARRSTKLRTRERKTHHWARVSNTCITWDMFWPQFGKTEDFWG